MENPPSEYVPTSGQPPQPPVPPQPQFLPPQPPVPPQQQFLPPQQSGAPQFPGGGGEAPYRAYTPASRKGSWAIAIVTLALLVLAIPALFLFIGIFTWATR